ncbi:MAG: ABC transporter substrate binding protein [Thomasclavelia sp.]
MPKQVAIMYCGTEDNSIFQADIAKEECAKRNLTVVDKSVTDSNQIQQVASH